MLYSQGQCRNEIYKISWTSTNNDVGVISWHRSVYHKQDRFDQPQSKSKFKIRLPQIFHHSRSFEGHMLSVWCFSCPEDKSGVGGFLAMLTPPGVTTNQRQRAFLPSRGEALWNIFYCRNLQQPRRREPSLHWCWYCSSGIWSRSVKIQKIWWFHHLIFHTHTNVAVWSWS